MPVEKWSDKIDVVRLADDPQFTEDLQALTPGPGGAPSAASSPRSNVVLDFAAVHFINSSNISALLRLRRAMILDEARLVLCNIKDPVWGTFLVTGLDKIFEFSDNVTTCLATLQMNAPSA